MAHFVCLHWLTCDPDLLTLKLVRNVTRVMGVPSYQFWWYYEFVFNVWAIWPTRLRQITWPLPWRSWHLWLMQVAILHPYTEFEVRRPCHSEEPTISVTGKRPWSLTQVLVYMSCINYHTGWRIKKWAISFRCLQFVYCTAHILKISITYLQYLKH